jgi:HEAT repeat protein
VESLISLVHSGNFFRTFPAIDVLGRSGDPRAVAPLAALLNDSRYALEAMRALSRTADRSATAPLTAMLAQRSPTHVRIAAVALADLARAYQERYGVEYVIESLVSQSAPPGAVRALGKSLNGANTVEREAIARVLGMLPDADAVPVLSSLVDGPASVAKAAARALGGLGPKVASQLIELLRSGDSTRRAVVLPLISSRMSAEDEIVGCLSDPDGNVRALAAEALARIAAVRHVGTLFPLLEDPNPRVVQAAAAAIQALGSKETEQLTLQAARSGNVRVRREALRIIRFFGYRSALPIVLSTLDEGDERLREAAIMALPYLEDPDALTALQAQAHSEHAKTRAIATRALGQVPPSHSIEDALIESTRDPDAWVRYYAAQALGKLAVLRALPQLVALLSDSAGQVRVAAVEALSHLSTDQAFSALAEAATSGEPDVRRAAVLGFGILKRADALPILIQALRSEDSATRLVAASALGRFEVDEAVEALGHAARDADESVRLTAIGLLADISSAVATLALVRLLPECRDVDRVRLALSAASPGRISGIMQALQTADDEIAGVLASALARMRTREATQALIETLGTPNTPARKAAVTALAAMGTNDALDAVRTAGRTDSDPEVRRISVLATASG